MYKMENKSYPIAASFKWRILTMTRCLTWGDQRKPLFVKLKSSVQVPYLWSIEEDVDRPENETRVVTSGQDSGKVQQELETLTLSRPFKYSEVFQDSWYYCSDYQCRNEMIMGRELLEHDNLLHISPPAPSPYTCFTFRCANYLKYFTKAELMEHLTLKHALLVYSNDFGGITIKLDNFVEDELCKPLFALAYDKTYFIGMCGRTQVGEEDAIFVKLWQGSVIGNKSKKYNAKITFCGNQECFSSYHGPVSKINTGSNNYMMDSTNCLKMPEAVKFYGCKSMQVLIMKHVSSEAEGDTVDPQEVEDCKIV